MSGGGKGSMGAGGAGAGGTDTGAAAYLQQMFGLAGSVAVITGGGGVLAGHMAEALLKAGASVSLWGPHESSLRETAERAGAAAGAESRITRAIADAGSEESVAAAAEAVIGGLGRLDILVNAVGGTRGKGPFVETDVALFEEVLRLNLVAGLLVPTKVICRRWLADGVHGCIVNMASMGSYVPLSGVWAYDAAKAAVLNLTTAAAKEFAPQGIRVNAIAPGFFLGKQNRALLVDQATGNFTARGQSVISRTPFGRFGDPQELAGALLFLASARAAGFVTGVCIPVDGGFLTDNT
jgi:NAD(P)-dependent dehydrogenase (short-subunit alcohol dehydrogenase family)